jgi:hypothetical protein
VAADIEQHQRVVGRNRVERRGGDRRAFEQRGPPLPAGHPFAGLRLLDAGGDEFEQFGRVGVLRYPAAPFAALGLQDRVDVHVVQAGQDGLALEIDHLPRGRARIERDDPAIAHGHGSLPAGGRKYGR